jgi:hypothetical protein
MAPEIYRCEKAEIAYGTKSDLFGLGVIAHIMLAEENPLKGKTGQIDRSMPVHWDESKLLERSNRNGLELVAGLMAENPVRRWDISKLLHSRFLTEVSENQKCDSYSTNEDKTHLLMCGSF